MDTPQEDTDRIESIKLLGLPRNVEAFCITRGLGMAIAESARDAMGDGIWDYDGCVFVGEARNVELPIPDPE